MSVRSVPDLAIIGERIQAERIRLGLSQTAMAGPAGLSKSALIGWESGKPYPTDALAAFHDAGADVLFIGTGQRATDIAQSAEPLAGVTVRQALAMLDPVDRHRLFLDLLAAELAA